MFYSTYKTTIKNLFRSTTFWLTVIVFIVVALHNALSASHGYFSDEYKELIWDTDSRYVLEYKSFIQRINNNISSLLVYIIPIFSVVSTVIILNRDYGDKFFEIEKAGGMKPSCYILGKVSALISVDIIISVIVSFLSLNLYVFTRNGVNGMELWNYITESSIRLLRADVYRIIPCVIFYVCFTYFIGALCNSRVAAAIGGLCYAVFCYANALFNVTKEGWYIEYVTPNPTKLSFYMQYYDTEWFENTIKSLKTSTFDALMCIAILVGLGIVFAILSYLRIRKRTV